MIDVNPYLTTLCNKSTPKNIEKSALTFPPRPFQPSPSIPTSQIIQQRRAPVSYNPQQPISQPINATGAGRGRPAGPSVPNMSNNAGNVNNSIPGQTGVEGQPSAVAPLVGQSSNGSAKGYGNTPSTSGKSPTNSKSASISKKGTYMTTKTYMTTNPSSAELTMKKTGDSNMSPIQQSLSDAPGQGLGMGVLGMLAGGGAGTLVGAGRGNAAEGAGRGILRGGMTGAGIGLGHALGSAAGSALGSAAGNVFDSTTAGATGKPIGGLAGIALGGLGGYALGGKMLGKPVGGGDKPTTDIAKDDKRKEEKTKQAKHRELSEKEQHEVSDAQKKILPTIFQHYGTPIPEMMSSPGWGAGIHGGLGALLGGGLGAALGSRSPDSGAGMALGGGLGALAGGGLGAASGYIGRWQNNKNLEEVMRNARPGATMRDYLTDPAASGDLNRQALMSAGMAAGGMY